MRRGDEYTIRLAWNTVKSNDHDWVNVPKLRVPMVDDRDPRNLETIIVEFWQEQGRLLNTPAIRTVGKLNNTEIVVDFQYLIGR